MLHRSNGQALPRLGAAAVELAVLLPFLVFLFLVGTDYCRLFYYSLTLANCARNGAHFGSGVTNSQDWQNKSALIATITDATLADGVSLSPALAASNVTAVTGKDADDHSMVQVT